MNNISNEAENEVQDLLNRLVVNRINTELKEQIESILSEIGKMKEEELKKISTSVKGLPNKISAELSSSFDSVPQAINGNLFKLESKIGEIQQQNEQTQKRLELLDNLKNDLANSLSKIIKESNSNLQQQLSGLLNKIQKEMATQRSLTEESNKIQAKIADIEKKVASYEYTSSQSMSGISQKLSEITERMPSVATSESVERYYNTLSTSLTRIDNSISKKDQEMADRYEQITIKNEKKLSMVILLSIINIIGLIVVIVALFLH